MSDSRKRIFIRWSDLDPNFHLRHSAYYDFAAQRRIEFLQEAGVSIKIMEEQHFGPVLFREECVFKREIRFGDPVFITTSLLRVNADSSRWSIQHEFVTEEGKVLAILTVDGAWMDTKSRRLAEPTPPLVVELLQAFPKSKDFSLI